MEIAELIHGPRQGNGLSQRDLGSLANIPQPSIAELESGAQSDATVSLVERLLTACGSRLVAVPTTTPPVCAAGVAIRRAVREGRTGLVLRQLLQVVDDLSREPASTALALSLTPPPHTGHRGADAFLAAIVDHRLEQAGLPVPDWTSSPERVCEPAWDVAGIPELTDEIRRSTPEAFLRHGLLIAEEDLAGV